MSERPRLREHWDRALLFATLTGYGTWSLFRQAGTMADSPPWVSTPTYVGFIAAGLLLAVGWFGNRPGPYLVGNVLTAAALASVGFAVIAVNVNPGSLLVFGFATAVLIMLRRTSRDQRMLSELRRSWPRADG